MDMPKRPRGRPALVVPRFAITVKIEKALIEALDAAGGRNRSDKVNDLIRAHIRRDAA